MSPDPTSRRHPRASAVVAALLAATALLVLQGPVRADDGSSTGSGTVKDGSGTLSFGIGPANHVPAKQVVDGRAYLVYSADPGATIIDRVALFNYGTKPLTLQVYATDAVQSADGAFGLLPGNDAPADAGRWIKLLDVPKSGKVTVPGRTSKAYGVKLIRFVARVPKGTTPGDHVGGVLASLKSVGKNKKGAKITLDQRIGVRAYFSVAGKLAPGVKIEDLHASYENTWDPRGLGDYTVSYYVHNTGNLRLDVSQDLKVDRCVIAKVLCPAGSLVTHPDDLLDLLPGSRIKVTKTFEHRFGLGHPSASVTLHPKAIDQSYTKAIPVVSASTGLWALPWLLIIIVVLVLLAIAGGSWRLERRRRLRARERELEASKPRPKHAAPETQQPGARRAAGSRRSIFDRLRRRQG
jgi:hypothetical protein